MIQNVYWPPCVQKGMHTFSPSSKFCKMISLASTVDYRSRRFGFLACAHRSKHNRRRVYIHMRALERRVEFVCSNMHLAHRSHTVSGTCATNDAPSLVTTTVRDPELMLLRSVSKRVYTLQVEKMEAGMCGEKLASRGINVPCAYAARNLSVSYIRCMYHQSISSSLVPRLCHRK